MTKFKVSVYDGETGEEYYEEDELFDTRDEAEEAGRISLESFSAGADVLNEIGQDFTDPTNAEYDVEEVDE